VKLADVLRATKYASKYAKVDHAKNFAKHVVPEVVRPARVIWNQAIGAVFFLLAIPALFKAIQLYRDSRNEPNNDLRLLLLLTFVAVMAFFGVSSFLKARRIARRL
jgi:hypothetical protein